MLKYKIENLNLNKINRFFYKINRNCCKINENWFKIFRFFNFFIELMLDGV